MHLNVILSKRFCRVKYFILIVTHDTFTIKVCTHLKVNINYKSGISIIMQGNSYLILQKLKRPKSKGLRTKFSKTNILLTER